MRSMTFPRKVYDYLVKNWIFTAFLLTVSTNWFLILRIVGTGNTLINDDGKLTTIGNWITWPLFGISVIFALLKTAADKYNETAKYNGHYVLDKMLQSVNSVVGKKTQRFINYISDHSKSSNLTPFDDITQPRVQIDCLLDNMQVTLSDIFGISRDDIGISIIYKSDVCANWHWLCTLNLANDLDLNTIVNNSCSTARQVIDGKEKSIFIPDKRVGVSEGKYLPGAKDKTYNNIGSVLCREISIRNGDVYITAVLCVTTYGKQICDNFDTDTRQKVENLLIPTFETRLRLELALLYIKEVLTPNLEEISA